jgi:hypothetical protein
MWSKEQWIEKARESIRYFDNPYRNGKPSGAMDRLRESIADRWFFDEEFNVVDFPEEYLQDLLETYKPTFHSVWHEGLINGETRTDIPLQFLTKIRDRFPIPSEFVVREPKFVVPDYGRTFDTGLAILPSGRIGNYDALRQELFENDEEFRGWGDFELVMLVEVWADGGDDGHTHYELIGWAYAWGEMLQTLTSFKY